VEPDTGAAVDRTEVFSPIGMMIGIEVKRDDAASLSLWVLRCGDVDVVVAADGEMAYRAEPFRDDAGVKARRQRKTIGLWGDRK